MFAPKKTTRNIRKKGDEDGSSSAAEPAKKEPIKKNLLSFGDEEEEAVDDRKYKAKKEQSGREKEVVFKKSTKSEQKVAPQSAYFSSSSGEYTPDRLAQLKKNSFIWGQGSVEKPVSRKEKKGKSDPSASSSAPPPPPIPDEMEVPSEQQIEEAKRRREEMRRQQSQSSTSPDEFIPLDSSKPAKSHRGGPLEDRVMGRSVLVDRREGSRLVREDADDEEEDEDGTNMPLELMETRRVKMGAVLTSEAQERHMRAAKATGEAQISGRRKAEMEAVASAAAVSGEMLVGQEAIRVAEATSAATSGRSGGGDSDMEDSEDEEMKRWEMEQMRKAGISTKQQQRPTRTRGGSQSPPLPLPAPQHAPVPLGLAETSGVRPMKGQTKTIEVEDISQFSFEALERRLQQAHDRLLVERDETKSELTRVDGMLTASDSLETKEKTKFQKLSAEYVFLQEMNDYIDDLVDCLAEKVPVLEDSEEQLFALRREFYTSLREQRKRAAEEIWDDIQTDLGISTESNKSNNEPDYDEFGRDRSHFRKVDRERRKAERARLASDPKAIESVKCGDVPSDDDEEVLTTKYRESRDELLSAGSGIFNDVGDEYRSLSRIKAKFHTWKFKFADSYRSSKCSDHIPLLLSPFVRQELLPWQPLRVPSLHNTEWYTTLFDFGLDENLQSGAAAGSGSNGPQTEDSDLNLVPQLMQEVALPIADQALTGQYDPLSSRHTAAAVELLNEMFIYVDSSFEPMKNCLKGTMELLRRTADDLIVPAHRFSEEDPSNPDFAFCRTQFWLGVKFVKNLGLWQEVLSKKSLQAIAVDRLIVPKLIPHLNAASPSSFPLLAEKLTDALSEEWLPEPGSNRGPSAILKPLHSAIVEFAHKTVSLSSGDARRLSRTLSKLGDTEEATSVLHKHGLR